jgi:predicted ATPase
MPAAVPTGERPITRFLENLCLSCGHGGAAAALATLYQAKELLSIADRLGESGLVLIGHRVLGTALTINADCRGALPHLEYAVGLYKPHEHSRFTSQFAHDIGVTAYAAWSWALWHSGYPDRANDAATKAVRYAEELAHMPTLAYALLYSGTTAVLGRRVAEAEPLANGLVELATDRGFAFLLGYGLILQGWVMAQRGRVSQGIELIREGLTRSQRTGARAIEPFSFGLLGEAYGASGKPEKGLLVLREAFASAERSGLKAWNAELHRLRGDLLQHSSNASSAEVESSFRAGVLIARDQGRRGYETRTAAPTAGL